VFKKIYGSKIDELGWTGGNYIMSNLKLYSSHGFAKVVKSRV